MDELDELPTWAARTHAPGTNLPLQEAPGEQPPKGGPLRWLLFGTLGLLALGAMAGIGYVAANALGSDGNETASTGDDAGVDDADLEEAGGAVGDQVAVDDAADDASADTEADGAAAGDTTDRSDSATTDGGPAADGSDDATSSDVTEPRGGEVVDNSDGSIRYAVLEGGVLYLRGRVHSEEYGSAVEEVALGVMGPGNVVNEYEIDPSTPDALGGPVYVEDVVLFEFNSIEVAPPFLPILDLGTLLMTQNPSVTIQVITRTDAVGSEAANLEVAQLRGDAIVRYWERQGIDPARITVVPKGEEEASDDGAEAALDRRAEFVIDNLFG